ncbi:MAG: universal stress protein [Gammaproteobacteria bacterium]|nr:universal stress protein [Gammaproteobacteria bacterium]
MSDRKTILAILELDSEPNRLLKRVAWLANSFDCRVHLVLFAPDDGALLGGFALSNEADAIRRELHSAQESLVDEFAQRLRADNIDVDTSVLMQRPLGDAILETVSAVSPTMVVKATQHHSVAERRIMVDTDWQLMRVCPVPLWFVKADSMPENPVIVAAVDPTHAHDKPAALDHEIVNTANAVAKIIDGDVHLVHTYENLGKIGTAANRTFVPVTLPIDEIDARVRAEHRAALDKLAADCGVDSEHVHQLPGRSNEILPAFARSKDAGLFIMGALARWGLKRAIIGSTAERVIDHIPCDTLIVRLGEQQLWS